MLPIDKFAPFVFDKLKIQGNKNGLQKYVRCCQMVVFSLERSVPMFRVLVSVLLVSHLSPESIILGSDSFSYVSQCWPRC
jgi:hypothetical protein